LKIIFKDKKTNFNFLKDTSIDSSNKGSVKRNTDSFISNPNNINSIKKYSPFKTFLRKFALDLPRDLVVQPLQSFTDSFFESELKYSDVYQ